MSEAERIRLPEGYELVSSENGWNVVNTPVAYPDGDVIQVWFRKVGDGFRLTDMGETASYVFITTGKELFNSRRKALNKILSRYGVRYEGGELITTAGEEGIGEALTRLVAAARDVAWDLPKVIVDDEYIERHTRTVYVYMCKNTHRIKHHTEAEYVVCPFCWEKTSTIVDTEQTSPEPYTDSGIIKLLHNVRKWLLEKWESGRFHNPDRVFENIGNISQWRHWDMLEFMKMMADGQFSLPDRYMQLLTHDAGYIFLWGVFAGSKEFYVCEDCGALHPAEYYTMSDLEEGGHCEICGDNGIAFVVRIEGTEIMEVERR